jgi:hypothetical protein
MRPIDLMLPLFVVESVDPCEVEIAPSQRNAILDRRSSDPHIILWKHLTFQSLLTLDMAVTLGCFLIKSEDRQALGQIIYGPEIFGFVG